MRRVESKKIIAILARLVSATITIGLQLTVGAIAADMSVTPPPGLIDMLRDPNWKQAALAHYHGDIDIVSANNTSLIRQIDYVSALLSAMSKSCPASIHVTTPVSQVPSKIMIIASVPDGSVSSVKAALGPLFAPGMLKITTGEDELVNDAAKQLVTSDYSVTSI